jgi:signal transduction histidine kinase
MAGWTAGGAARAPSVVMLAGLALAGAGAATTSAALALNHEELADPGLRAALIDWLALTYLLAGLVAWWRRPDSRLGPLMVVAGFTTFLSTLAWAHAALPFTFGQALDLVPLVLFLHVFLAYPSGRLAGRRERLLVATAYATALGLELVRMALGGFGPRNLLEVVEAPEAALAVQRVQLLALSASALAAAAILIARRRKAGRPLRWSLSLLIDSFALALVALAVLLVTAVLGAPGWATIQRVTLFAIGLAPLAFLLGLLRARLARSAVADLLVELRTDPAPADLRDALARALRDPSLRLAFWLPDFGIYAHADGRPVERPEAGARGITMIDRNGTHVAALLHDPALDDEPELLEAVTAAAGIALENAQLHAELRARLEELKGSRARIVEAGQKERQRLERNLHDGAQQRLVALSLELGRLEERLGGDPDARTRVSEARREIATSLEELRAVARGIHPAVVTGHGLEVALEQLAARAPVPVRLDVAVDGRLPERVEVAAFYLVAEALANIGKHAHASAATVEVAEADGTVVVVVADDGVGGAAAEEGSGLRGLADRVEALEGRLWVGSPAGGGTRLRAEIPCAS